MYCGGYLQSSLTPEFLATFDESSSEPQPALVADGDTKSSDQPSGAEEPAEAPSVDPDDWFHQLAIMEWQTEGGR